MNKVQITDHFKWEKIICPCCDRVQIIPALWTHMDLLEELRSWYAKPIFLTSGYRCQSHNADVGGAARSWHLLFATDIQVEDMDDIRKLYEKAIEMRWGGIGRAETFLHLDLRPNRVLWRY